MLKTKKNKYITAIAGIALLAAILLMFYFVPPRMSATMATPTQQPPSTQPSSMKDVSTLDLMNQYIPDLMHQSTPDLMNQPTPDLMNQSTPGLIQQAFDKGEITDEQRLLYLAYALYESESLPAQFHSNVGWCGTSVMEDLEEAANSPLMLCSMSLSIRSEFQRLLKPNITCD